jgi:hypothetical protein
MQLSALSPRHLGQGRPGLQKSGRPRADPRPAFRPSPPTVSLLALRWRRRTRGARRAGLGLDLDRHRGDGAPFCRMAGPAIGPEALRSPLERFSEGLAPRGFLVGVSALARYKSDLLASC